jgi:hypothetical protein
MVQVDHDHPPPPLQKLLDRQQRILVHQKNCADCKYGPGRICRKRKPANLDAPSEVAPTMAPDVELSTSAPSDTQTPVAESEVLLWLDFE